MAKNVKLIKFTIDENALGEFLREEIEPALLGYGKKLASEMDAIQPTEGGWEAEIHRRPKRTTIVIVTDDPTTRHREAKNGKVAKALRSKTVKSNIRLKKTATGFTPHNIKGEDI